VDQINSLKTEHRFKKTEIGEIPVDWESDTLKSVAKINMGQSPSSKNCFDYENGLPFFQGKAEFGDKFPKVVKWCNSPKKLADAGDILISVRAPVGDVNIAPAKSCIGRGLAAIRGIRTNNKFLYFILYYFKDRLKKIGQGSTFKAINKNVLFDLIIPLPPLSEQKKIAEILSIVDEAIEKKKSIIEKSKELKKSLMQELLTQGIGHTKFKKTELGKIPEDWNVVRIKDICEIIGGSTPSTNIEEYWNGNIPWAVPTDITKLKDNVILDTERNISNKGLSNSAAKLLPVGSILLTSRATIGELAINLKPMATNQGFANFICRTEIYNWYLFYRLILIKKELKRLASGSTFKEISKNSIRAIKIPLPPLEEQMTIGDILLSLDEVIKQETKNTEYFKNVKKGVMAVLLTGKIRVKYF
jgi:type I restriction enzyme S subunit